eukprot:scaffold4850_cov340-Prasinococcus_capsulatus_cf.AAC.11
MHEQQQQQQQQQQLRRAWPARTAPRHLHLLPVVPRPTHELRDALLDLGDDRVLIANTGRGSAVEAVPAASARRAHSCRPRLVSIPVSEQPAGQVVAPGAAPCGGPGRPGSWCGWDPS